MLFICRRKNFEKTEEYKKAYARRDNDKTSDKANVGASGGKSEPMPQGGYIQRYSFI